MFLCVLEVLEVLSGGYPLAALGSEDWCDAIHAGVLAGGRPSVHGVAPSPTAPASFAGEGSECDPMHASNPRPSAGGLEGARCKEGRCERPILVVNAQPGAPARAGASHGAGNASECSPRLAQMRPSSQPIVHRLLKKHSDECGTGDAWQAGNDAVIGCCVPSE